MTSPKSEATADLGGLVEKLAEGLKLTPISRDAFVLPVETVSDDRNSVKVRLCTGGSLEVPIAALKSARRLGHILVDSERLEVASGEIDRSNHSGRLLHQMAIEFQRVAETLQTIRGGASRQPLDYGQPPALIKLPVSGTAGQPVKITYTAPEYHYIQNVLYPGDVGGIAGYVAEYVTFSGCFLLEDQSQLVLTPAPPADPNVRGNLLTGLILTVDAQHGTPLGQKYFASVWIKVTLIQETT